jgi:sigma-B regulation protein RsbU (phosphoserine phosphatase)
VFARPESGAGLLQTLPGRLLVLAGLLSIVLYGVAHVVALPEFIELFRKVVSLATIVAAAALGLLLLVRSRRAFLWRVRRKLILSYVFLGFVPLVLVVAFVFTGGLLLYMTVAQYVFQEAVSDTADVGMVFAATSAYEIGRDPAQALAAITRKQRNLATQYPRVSMAVVPVGGSTADRPIVAGPVDDGRPAASAPAWLTPGATFSGTLVYPDALDGGRLALLIRSVAPTPDGRRAIVADLPIDHAATERIAQKTGTGVSAVYVEGCGPASIDGTPPSRGLWSLFRETVAFMDCTNWTTGQTGSVYVSPTAPLGRLSERLASVRSSQITATVGESWWTVFVQLLVLLGVLFLIIQAAALVMGGVLVRSITSAVHELFTGTERVRQGDFAHRIPIESRDQLGDLADSFNRMSASIEHLLHVQREKQRLDDELRIAREIQKSLLPTQPPRIAGLDIADLCEPAREVGGDYYDFFAVGPRQLGVLIADVSGKGTSAALYMAELKGLMLALSHTERSPRRLLVDLNRRLADQLDNRNFITMTYAVIDLEARTLAMARAGHTPLLVVSHGQSTMLAPDGMVLGLRLPEAEVRFEQVLEEHTQPIAPGDVVVFYTDGVTEAMNAEGDLFGDGALARVVAAQQGRDAAGIRERVVREVKAFVGEAEPHDDMTLVVLRVTDEAA